MHQRGSRRSLLLEEKGKTQNLTVCIVTSGAAGMLQVHLNEESAPSTGCFAQPGIRHHTGSSRRLWLSCRTSYQTWKQTSSTAPAVLTCHRVTQGPRPGKQISIHSPYDPGNSDNILNHASNMQLILEEKYIYIYFKLQAFKSRAQNV